MKIREIFEKDNWPTEDLDRNPARERILDGQLARLERIGWKYWGVLRVPGRKAAKIWFT